jgi:hypothetical protein
MPDLDLIKQGKQGIRYHQPRPALPAARHVQRPGQRFTFKPVSPSLVIFVML